MAATYQLDTVLLVGAAVLLAAVLAVRLSVRAGLPSLLIYLAMGVGLGESGLGIRFDDAALASTLGFVALILILAEGGLTTRWSDIRPSMWLAIALATVGVVVSVVIVAVLTHYLLGLDWRQAALLGAVISSTDAAAVFSVLRHVPLRRRLVGVVEAESGLNDATAVILVTLLSTSAPFDVGWLPAVAVVAYELVVGVVVGLAVGAGGAWLMRRVALPASGLYPLAALALCLLAYGSAASVHASGFAAVYVAALVLGNAKLSHRAATRSFAQGIAWLAQIGLFVMLGLLVSPGRLEWWHLSWGLVVGVALTFVARPVAVGVCGSPLRMPYREQVFVTWAGLRGAVPIVLATIPLTAGVPGAKALFDVVFVVVVVFTLIQGPTLPWVASRLRLTVSEHLTDLDVETAPLDRLAADLVHVRISEASRLAGVEVGQLRLPHGVSLALIVRSNETLVPELRTVLRHGDEMLLVSPRSLREQAERRLRAVSRGGRLAGWLDQHGDV